MSQLKAEFLSGLFGDPALYVADPASRRAILLDCGDLAQFLPRQLLRVSHIFLSHCHMDHFAGFDHFLRLHMGKAKRVVIVGPPETSARVAGKLAGYTWNLEFDRELCFEVWDLDFAGRRRLVTEFSSSRCFRAEPPREASWDPGTPVYDAGPFRVYTLPLDHLTPSLAYAVEQRPSVQVSRAAVAELGLPIGAWIGALKLLYYKGRLDEELLVPVPGEAPLRFHARALAARLFTSRTRQKIAYVTDGAANTANEAQLLPFLAEADLLFHETCFLEEERALAASTAHFTAAFVGRLARRAGVKRLVPFHFSKRYISRPGAVFQEVAREFGGEVLRLPSRATAQPAYRAPAAPSPEGNV